MTSRQRLLFQWESDITRVVADLNTLEGLLARFEGQAEAKGKKGIFSGARDSLNDAIAGATLLEKKLERLRRLQQAQGTGRFPGLSDLGPEAGGFTVKGINQFRPRFEVRGGRGANAQQEARAILQAEQEVAALIETTGVKRLAVEQQILAQEREIPGLQAQALQLTNERLFREQRIRNAADPATGQGAIDERLRQIDQAREKLIQLRAQLEASVESAFPPDVQRAIFEEREKQLAKAAAATQRVLEIEQKRARVIQQINATDDPERKLAGQQRLTELDEQRAKFARQAAEAHARAERPDARREAILQAAGARGAFDQIDQTLAELQQLEGEALLGGLSSFAPELTVVQQRLEQIAAELRVVNPGSKEYNELIKEGTELLQQRRGLLQSTPGRGIPGIPNEQEIRTQVARFSKSLDSIVIGAFANFRRRFTQTFQFAISAAIIFGFQRLIRELFKAAVEVERAFADIETALQLDVDVERGSAGFRKIVGDIRREVLLAAQEFNVLPTEAAKAAFVMISRFQDSSNAIRAFRAQLLATKISGIETSETLRALTAVAETFASSVLEANNSLTLQERLLRRETVAAQLYGETLDTATLIQQRFGIEVEDTLEGTAQLAEVFRQLGFDAGRTAAIVALVGQRTGQTGQAAAERLARSIGQITSPQIREQLLELARASEVFTLSQGDFQRGGAQVFDTIARQFAAIERIDPDIARRIIQVLGQRREVAVVAAALGTADLQQEIVNSVDEATGAAAERFSFLAQTVSERLQSIAASFQELALNLEKAGVLNPIKILLSLLDNVLRVVNSLFREFQRLVDVMRTVPFVGGFFVEFGSVLAQATIGAIALRRALVLVNNAAGGLAASKLGTSISAGLSALLSGQIAASGPLAGVLGGRIGAGVGRAASGLAGGLAKAATALGSYTFWVAAAGVVTLELVNASREYERAIKEATDALNDIPNIVRARLSRDDFGSDAEFKAAVLRETLSLTRQAAPGTPGFKERAGSFLRGGLEPLFSFDQDTLRSITSGGAFNIAEAFRDAANVDNLARSTRKDIAQLEEDFILAQAEFLNEEFARALQNASRLGLDPKLISTFGLFADQATDRLLQQLAEADTPEKRAEIIDLLDKYYLDLGDFITALGIGPDEIASTVKSVQDDIGRIDRDLQLGVIGRGDVRDRLLDGLSELKSQLRFASPEQVPEILDAIAGIYVDLNDDARAQFENARKQNQLIRNDEGRLIADIELLGDELRRIADTVGTGVDLWLDTLLELIEAQEQLDTLRIESRLGLAQGRVSRARNLDEFLSASNVLADALLDAMILASQRGDAGEFRRLNQERLDVFREQGARKLAENTERAVQARIASLPVFAELRDVEVGLIRITEELANFTGDESRRMELLNEQRQFLAERQKVLLARYQAAALLAAGVNNQILQLKAQITINARELEQTAVLVGTESAAYRQLQLQQLELQNELVNAQLELESLNRRLGTDVTDSFAAAEQDLIDTLRRLQIPDLGELERAQLELERKTKQAAFEREFFSDRLFQLEFLFETGAIGTSAYIGALRRLLEQVDTSTKQGKEIFLEIQGIIDGLVGDLQGLQFNIPSAIRLPTLFEVRRALAADQLGVNYQDNRQIDIRVDAGNIGDLESIFRVIEDVFNTSIDRGSLSLAPGAAQFTIGGF